MPEPAGAVHVLELRAPVDADAVDRAADVLRRSAGVGAVVVRDAAGRPTAVVTWQALARTSGPGLEGLRRRLAAGSYALVDEALQPWAPEQQHRLPGPVGTVARRARNLSRVRPRQRAANARRRWRRRRFLLQLRLEAWLSGSELRLSVAKDLYVEPGIRLQMGPVPAVLEIGPRCRLLSGTVLRLRGELLVGPGCEIRHDVSLNVKGRLQLHGRAVLCKGAMLHADTDLQVDWGAVVAEYATVLDSSHERDGSLLHMFDQGVPTRPVRLGASSFVGAKATVLPGVTLGEGAVVGANSVVTRDVAPWTTVVGAPAEVVESR